MTSEPSRSMDEKHGPTDVLATLRILLEAARTTGLNVQFQPVAGAGKNIVIDKGGSANAKRRLAELMAKVMGDDSTLRDSQGQPIVVAPGFRIFDTPKP